MSKCRHLLTTNCHGKANGLTAAELHKMPQLQRKSCAFLQDNKMWSTFST